MSSKDDLGRLFLIQPIHRIRHQMLLHTLYEFKLSPFISFADVYDVMQEKRKHFQLDKAELSISSTFVFF